MMKILENTFYIFFHPPLELLDRLVGLYLPGSVPPARPACYVGWFPTRCSGRCPASTKAAGGAACHCSCARLQGASATCGSTACWSGDKPPSHHCYGLAVGHQFQPRPPPL